MPEFDSTIEYRSIQGFPGRCVGNDGSLWTSLERNARRGFQSGFDYLPSDQWRQMSVTHDNDGYRMVTLSWRAKRRSVKISVLVLEEFIGPRPEGCVAAHGNGINTDDRLANLRWATHVENHADMKLHGTHMYGETAGNHRLTSEQVAEIRRRRLAGEKGTAIAKDFGITATLVCEIYKRRCWRHLP